MKLSAHLFGQTYQFKDVKDVLAKASDGRSGDVPISASLCFGRHVRGEYLLAIAELLILFRNEFACEGGASLCG